MSDFFVEAPEQVSIKKQNQVLSDPFIHKNFVGEREEADIFFLAEKPMSRRELYSFKRMMGNQFSQIKYCIYSSIIIEPTKKDLDSQITKFYKRNRVNLSNTIPKGKHIVSIGKANIAITKSDDLMTPKKPNEDRSIIQGFYDTLLGNTFYFSPELKCKVWPIDPLNSWLGKDNFENWFVKTQIERAYKDEWIPKRSKPIKIIEVDNPNQWLLDRINGTEDVSWDIETKGLDPWAVDGRILEISFSFDGYVGYYMKWEGIDTELLGLFFKGRRCIGTNLKYDKKWVVVKSNIKRSHINIYLDTMHMSHTINEMRRMGLKSSVWMTTEDLGGYDQELSDYIDAHPECKSDYSLIPDELRIPYSGTDPCASYRVAQFYLNELEELSKVTSVSKCHPYLGVDKWNVKRWYLDVIAPSLNTFSHMELNGMTINWEKVDLLSEEIAREIRYKKKEILDEINESEDSFNVDSNEQMGAKLESLGWTDEGRSKKGEYLVNDNTLTRWISQGHKLAYNIKELHELQQLMKTFIGNKVKGNGFYKYRKPDDKVHAFFGVALTNSNRNNCKDPNLQNQKKRGYKAKDIRGYYMPPSKDHLVAEYDGAGLQLRIIASLSGDENMKDAFVNLGGDLHSMSSKELFKPEITLNQFMANLKDPKLSKEYKLLRYAGKAPNFSLCFNTTPYSFAKDTLMNGPYAWSEEMVMNYLEKNNLMGVYQEKNYQELKELGLASDYDRKKKSLMVAYLISAEDIKEKFFKKYPKVKEYIDNIISFGNRNGYVISPFGTIRRLPYLQYQGLDTDKGKIKNLHNICTNSPVQAYEVYIILSTMNAMDQEIESKDLNSEMNGQVHDSIVWFPHKDELYNLSRLAKSVFEKDLFEHRGIPYLLEMELGVYSKEEYWGFGKEYELDELKNLF